ncbi:uncharacterized protein BO80DRAFT_208211 [Aspergillus ibericus CBS 121593]|uniref:Uncharacterized protein n=1 Tax=Aspergillus ibericus CBS 121593 TaxID=1448316 RepID=A0A395HAU7_9EURO|nr:hypothetical protein BO80DRAFT_208211 [Aspergillus ibericus CBS 121593]RAL04776.1 hypothetical protein BO80DRAFT_208211 [Aspergillus ibericus CBS 121593]
MKKAMVFLLPLTFQPHPRRTSPPDDYETPEGVLDCGTRTPRSVHANGMQKLETAGTWFWSDPAGPFKDARLHHRQTLLFLFLAVWHPSRRCVNLTPTTYLVPAA